MKNTISVSCLKIYTKKFNLVSMVLIFDPREIGAVKKGIPQLTFFMRRGDFVYSSADPLAELEENGGLWNAVCLYKVPQQTQIWRSKQRGAAL